MIIAVHGRNQDEVLMKQVLTRAGVAHLPTAYAIAPNKTWYADKFMAPIETNEVDLNRSLKQLESIHQHLNSRGYADDQICFIGFSQGACLCSQYLLTHPAKYHSIFILTGGYVGPPGIDWNFTGDFQRTPVYITTSQIDEWVPPVRTGETAREFERLNAAANYQLFQDRIHEVCDQEIQEIHMLLAVH